MVCQILGPLQKSLFTACEKKKMILSEYIFSQFFLLSLFWKHIYSTWSLSQPFYLLYNLKKILYFRVRFEESDNAIVRSARLLTDKVQDMFGFIFTRTELSEVLTEIVKMDPNFDKEQFLKDCENDFIPNILEAMTRGDLEVLEDWCYEAPFNILATPIRQAKQMGYMISSKVTKYIPLDTWYW